MAAVLGRLLEEQLVTQADAQQRLALACQLDQLPAQVAGLEPFQGRREGADSGQHEAVGMLELVLLSGDLGARSDVEQSPLDRPQVADPVVDDGDQPSRPLEDGMPRPPTAIASRSARPNALAADSAM